MGGLGANIGGENWEKAKKKTDLIKEYSQNVRLHQKPPMKRKATVEEVKEKTAREKAAEFAKNVPKPKVKSSVTKENLANQKQYESDLDGVMEDIYGENSGTMGASELAELNKKHDAYQAELEKIK